MFIAAKISMAAGKAERREVKDGGLKYYFIFCICSVEFMQLKCATQGTMLREQKPATKFLLLQYYYALYLRSKLRNK